MEHSSSVLALAGALLLAGGGGSRLEHGTSGFAERSAASTWSRPLRTPEQVGTPDSGGPLGGPVSHSSMASCAIRGAPSAAAHTAGGSSRRGRVSATEAALTPGG